jgi:hypothetical protein
MKKYLKEYRNKCETKLNELRLKLQIGQQLNNMFVDQESDLIVTIQDFEVLISVFDEFLSNRRKANRKYENAEKFALYYERLANNSVDVIARYDAMKAARHWRITLNVMGLCNTTRKNMSTNIPIYINKLNNLI